MEANEVTGSCANGVCTVHGPSGKSEYSEVFEKFVPAFFAGAQVKQTFPRTCYDPMLYTPENMKFRKFQTQHHPNKHETRTVSRSLNINANMHTHRLIAHAQLHARTRANTYTYTKTHARTHSHIHTNTNTNKHTHAQTSTHSQKKTHTHTHT